MGLLRWLTKNYAETVTPSHSDLKPIPIDRVKLGKGADLDELLYAGSGWKVETIAPSDGSALPDRVKPLVGSASFSAHLTHKTGIVGFIDDVWIWIDRPKGRVELQAYSASRVGKGDLGQNRRNIFEMQRLLESICLYSILDRIEIVVIVEDHSRRRKGETDDSVERERR